MKREHSLEDFESVKRILEDSKKRMNSKLLEGGSYSLGYLEKYILLNDFGKIFQIKDLETIIKILNSYTKLFTSKKYIT